MKDFFPLAVIGLAIGAVVLLILHLNGAGSSTASTTADPAQLASDVLLAQILSGTTGTTTTTTGTGTQTANGIGPLPTQTGSASPTAGVAAIPTGSTSAIGNTAPGSIG